MRTKLGYYIIATTLLASCRAPTEPERCSIQPHWTDSTHTQAVVTVYPDWYVKICNQVNGRKP